MHQAGRMRAQPDRGDIPGWAMMIPIGIALFLAAAQTAMWFQARNMCQSAVQVGVRAGRAYNAGPQTGSAAATAYLSQTAGNTASAATVTEQLSATTITVTCRAGALTLLPLPGLTVANQSATAARERFTTPGSP